MLSQTCSDCIHAETKFGLCLFAISCLLLPVRLNAQPAPEDSNQQTPAEFGRQTKTKPVLVANRDIEIGSSLRKEDFTIEQWPTDIAPDGVASSFEDIDNKLSTVRIIKLGPVFKESILDRENVRPRVSIPIGFKVLGVRIKQDDSLDGLLTPGDRVDVVGVFKSQDRRVAKTFLRNILVFSIAGKSNPRNTSGDSIVGLLVNEKQSEQLVLVQKVADIRLVLRGRQEPADAIRKEDSDDSTTFNELIDQIDELNSSLDGSPQSDNTGDGESAEYRQKIRDASRKLDQTAADLEELELYRKADELREIARELRLGVRNTRPNKLNKHGKGDGASQQP